MLERIQKISEYVVKYGNVHHVNGGDVESVHYLDGLRVRKSLSGHHVLNGPLVGPMRVGLAIGQIGSNSTFSVSFDENHFVQIGSAQEHLADIDDWINHHFNRLGIRT